jgi:hypothetical protein
VVAASSYCRGAPREPTVGSSSVSTGDAACVALTAVLPGRSSSANDTSSTESTWGVEWLGSRLSGDRSSPREKRAYHKQSTLCRRRASSRDKYSHVGLVESSPSSRKPGGRDRNRSLGSLSGLGRLDKTGYDLDESGRFCSCFSSLFSRFILV